jgi:iron-sulfur cluster repair protein YtfE (RIC family)
MNALELLKEDHRKVEHLFGKVKATEEDEHKELFEKIKAELDVHTHIEETIFYPKIKDSENEELEDLVAEGFQEHYAAKELLREISSLVDDSEAFEPKLKVLMESVTHHVQEEEGEMFPKIEEIFDETTLEELGAEMEEEKQSFKKTQAAGAGK